MGVNLECKGSQMDWEREKIRETIACGFLEYVAGMTGSISGERGVRWFGVGRKGREMVANRLVACIVVNEKASYKRRVVNTNSWGSQAR